MNKLIRVIAAIVARLKGDVFNNSVKTLGASLLESRYTHEKRIKKTSRIVDSF